MPNVNRTDYPYHSHYRVARRLQWHRGRTVLWHRILWRRWPRTHFRHPADLSPPPTGLTPHFSPFSSFPDVQLHIGDAPLGADPDTHGRGYGFRVRSFHSRPGMTG